MKLIPRFTIAAFSLAFWAPVSMAGAPLSITEGPAEVAFGCELRVQMAKWDLRQRGVEEPKAFPADRYQAALMNNVRRVSLMAGYLEERWGFRLHEGHFRDEVHRIERDTRDGEGWSYIQDAFAGDSRLLADCFLRPALVERYARAFFGRDESAHRETGRLAALGRNQAETGLVPNVQVGNGTNANRQELSIAVDSNAEDVAIVLRWLDHYFDGHGRAIANVASSVSGYRDSTATDDARLNAAMVDELAPRERLDDRLRQLLDGHRGWLSPIMEDESQFHFVLVRASDDETLVTRFEWLKQSFDNWSEQGLAEFQSTFDRVDSGFTMPNRREVGGQCDIGSWTRMRVVDWMERVRSGGGTGIVVSSGTEVLYWAGFRSPPSGLIEPAPIHSNEHRRPYNEGAVYSPATNSWRPMSTVGAPSPRTPDGYGVGVWTGTELFVYGGTTRLDDGTLSWLNDGGLYDPASDSWRQVPESPPAYRPTIDYSVVTTGTHVILYGGGSPLNGLSRGAILDLATLQWSTFEIASASIGGLRPGRGWHSMVWTGDTMLVFGGTLNSNPGGTATAFAYNPFTGVGYALPSFPSEAQLRDIHLLRASAFWHDGSVVLYKSIAPGEFQIPARRVALRYRVADQSWQIMQLAGDPLPGAESFDPVLVNGRLVVWGGKVQGGSTPVATGGIYSIANDSWLPVNPAGAPRARHSHDAVAVGTRMVTIGGKCSSGQTLIDCEDGASLDPASNIWTSFVLPPRQGPPTSRMSAAVAGNSSEFYVWGGASGNNYRNDGKRYDPITDLWTVLPQSASSPGERRYPVAAWTGAGFLVYGGERATPAHLFDGAVLDPVSNVWSPIADPYEVPMYQHGAASWDGEGLVAWGGLRVGNQPVGVGYRWTPSSGWSTMSTVDAPSPRGRHRAGSLDGRTLVWGGAPGGAIYDAASDTWQAIQPGDVSPPTSFGFPDIDRIQPFGDTLSLYKGGSLPPVLYVVDPDTNQWRIIHADDAPSRNGVSPIWTGKRLMVWGESSPTLERVGWLLAPGASSWTEPSRVDQPLARQYPMSARMGDYTVLWGGSNRISGRMFCEDTRALPLSADLQATLTASAGGVEQGVELHVYLDITNHGPDLVAEATATLDLASNLAYIAGPDSATACDTPPPFQHGQVRCTVRMLGVGETRRISVTAMPFAASNAEALAHVEAGTGETDPDDSNNAAQLTMIYSRIFASGFEYGAGVAMRHKHPDRE